MRRGIRLFLMTVMIHWFTGSAGEASDSVEHGMVGGVPDKVARIIAYLKKVNEYAARQSEDDSMVQRAPVFKNRLILYGPPGNGKTTLARKIAELTGSEFLLLAGPSIVGSYVGQGAREVMDTFKKAYETARIEHKCVVIFIDEIDAIAVSNNTEFRGEHQAALQQLWLELDACKNDVQIFVIFATNYFNKLNKTFLDRLGSNALEIKNPDVAKREKILAYYSTRYQVPMSPELIRLVARKSDGLSTRCLEDLICDIALSRPDGETTIDEFEVLKVLAQMRKKFDENISQEQENVERLQRWSLRVGIVTSCLTGVLSVYQLGAILYGSIMQKKGTSHTT
ncbi:AAA family ATPase [Candidatus Dependentiae bacterium]|nr:AAA family ATPase [Candidatus Dependentiae bacterium]